MASWDELVAVALLGTEQQKTPALSSAENALGALLAKLEQAAGKSRESVLLCAAGTIALHSRAGQAAQIIKAEGLPRAPEDDVPMISEIGPAKLGLLVSQYNDTLLPLWLEGIATAGKRVPDAAVPTLLHYAETHADMRERVANAIGHRGRWLASLNPEWAFAAGTPDETNASALKEMFETGLLDERLKALKQLRQSDPKAACELVQSTWKDETPDIRAKFLEVFRTNLSMDDEPFLESALDDKRKEVRVAAAALLSSLTESRYHQRMVERAKPLLKIVQEGGTKRIDISLPTTADAAMVRDGLTKAAAQVTAEQRNNWFAEMISVISPKVWESHFKLTAQELMSGLGNPTMRELWASAASLHGNEEWLELYYSTSNFSNRLANMMTSLSHEARERIILGMIARNKGVCYIHGQEYNQPIMVAMIESRHNWSEEFGRKLIPVLVEEARDGVNYYGKQLFSVIGFYFPTSLLKVMEESFEVVESETVEYVNKFLYTLRFKAELFGDIK